MVNKAALNLTSIIAAGIAGSGNVFSIVDTNGLCLDLFGGSGSSTSDVDFNPIDVFPCHVNDDGLNQQWTLTLVGFPSTFSISNVLHPESVMAFPTTATTSQSQGLVARINSSVTWNVAANTALGTNIFNLIETVDGNALTSFGSPLALEPFQSGDLQASQAFQVVPVQD